jgi:hypothetical protein
MNNKIQSFILKRNFGGEDKREMGSLCLFSEIQKVGCSQAVLVQKKVTDERGAEILVDHTVLPGENQWGDCDTWGASKMAPYSVYSALDCRGEGRERESGDSRPGSSPSRWTPKASVQCFTEPSPHVTEHNLHEVCYCFENSSHAGTVDPWRAS